MMLVTVCDMSMWSYGVLAMTYQHPVGLVDVSEWQGGWWHDHQVQDVQVLHELRGHLLGFDKFLIDRLPILLLSFLKKIEHQGQSDIFLHGPNPTTIKMLTGFVGHVIMQIWYGEFCCWKTGQQRVIGHFVLLVHSTLEEGEPLSLW